MPMSPNLSPIFQLNHNKDDDYDEKSQKKKKNKILGSVR